MCPSIRTLQFQMDSHRPLVQARSQSPYQKSDHKAVSIQAPIPNQLLRGAAKKFPRPSTTTHSPVPFTKPSAPRNPRQVRDTAILKSSTTESFSSPYHERPLHDRTPPLKKPASRLLLRRQHGTNEAVLNNKANPSQIPTQGGVGKTTRRPNKQGIPLQGYGQIRYENSLSPEANRRASQLPLRADAKIHSQGSAWLAARQPVRGPLNGRVRDPAGVTAQRDTGESVGTLIPPSSTPSIDVPLAANQEVVVRVGQQSLCLKNWDGNLVLRIEDTWQLLENVISVQFNLS